MRQEKRSGGIMQRKLTHGTAAIMSLALLLSGCATSPQDCQLNQTTTGALVGAGVGGAIGGIAAAASGLRSGAAFGVAAGALLVGAAVGAAIGHHNDQVCHQMALQQALDQAMAANAAWHAREMQQQEAQQQAYAAQAAPHSQHTPVAAPHRAMSTPTQQPEYMSVAWANKMTNTTGAITPLSSVTTQASDQVCMEFNDTEMVDGQSKAVTGKACRGPDGKWNPV
jgi:surface antigen